MNKEIGRTGREKLAFGIASGLLATAALSACGSETNATPRPTETHATPTETIPPADCDQPGKKDLGITVEDAFCKPASAAELDFMVTANKMGWNYPDPIAVQKAQQSLGFNTVDEPLPTEYKNNLAYIEKTYGLRDIEYDKKIETVKQASEAYNLLLPTLNKTVNDLVQYKAGFAPEELSSAVSANIIGDRKGTVIDWLVSEFDVGNTLDEGGRTLFVEEISALVEKLQPNQVVEFVKAAPTPATREENSTYFDAMEDVDSSDAANQSFEMKGTVKLKITTYDSGPNEVESSEDYIDFLAPDRLLVIFNGVLGGSNEPYGSIRFGVHDKPETATD